MKKIRMALLGKILPVFISQIIFCYFTFGGDIKNDTDQSRPHVILKSLTSDAMSSLKDSLKDSVSISFALYGAASIVGGVAGSALAVKYGTKFILSTEPISPYCKVPLICDAVSDILQAKLIEQYVPYASYCGTALGAVLLPCTLRYGATTLKSGAYFCGETGISLLKSGGYSCGKILKYFWHRCKPEIEKPEIKDYVKAFLTVIPSTTLTLYGFYTVYY